MNKIIKSSVWAITALIVITFVLLLVSYYDRERVEDVNAGINSGGGAANIGTGDIDALSGEALVTSSLIDESDEIDIGEMS